MCYTYKGTQPDAPAPVPPLSEDFVKCTKYGACRFRCASFCNTKEIITRAEAERIQQERKALPRTP